MERDGSRLSKGVGVTDDGGRSGQLNVPRGLRATATMKVVAASIHSSDSVIRPARPDQSHEKLVGRIRPTTAIRGHYLPERGHERAIVEPRATNDCWPDMFEEQ